MCAKSQSPVLDVPVNEIENGWSQMIEQLTVRNFRCFSDLHIEDLKQINIIVGPNSSGKSAFLESLFISSSSAAPNAAFNLRAIRRIGGSLQVPQDQVAYKGLWEDLFFDFDPNHKISIQVKGSAGSQRSLNISFKEAAQQELAFGKDVANTTGLSQIVFVWRRGGGKDIVVKPTITSTGLQLGTFSVDYFPLIWFTPGASDSAEDTAKRFSVLSKRNEIDPIVEALKAEFTFIGSLSIEFLAGLPMVFATVKGHSRKLPLGLVSDGVNRLLAILIGIAYFKGGTVLVDQLEDGIYYERFPSIWKTLHRFSELYKTQLFISTHSKECINSIADALRGNEDRFRLLRASRIDRGCTVESIPGDFMEAALEQQFEVR